MSARPSNSEPEGRSDDESTASRGERDGSRIRRFVGGALGGALLAAGIRRRSLGGAAASVAGGWLLARAVGGRDGLERALASAAGAVRERRGSDAGGMDASRSVTVGEAADDLYERWRDPDTLSRIVGPVAEVSAVDEDRLRWSVDGPLGRRLEWETAVTEERPGELLRWESVEGATVPTEGVVRFRPAPEDRGTEVTLSVRFDPPGGAVGDAAAERLGFVPETFAGAALDRFKSLVETGEIPTLERNPSARGSGDLV